MFWSYTSVGSDWIGRSDLGWWNCESCYQEATRRTPWSSTFNHNRTFQERWVFWWITQWQCNLTTTCQCFGRKQGPKFTIQVHQELAHKFQVKLQELCSNETGCRCTPNDPERLHCQSLSTLVSCHLLLPVCFLVSNRSVLSLHFYKTPEILESTWGTVWLGLMITHSLSWTQYHTMTCQATQRQCISILWIQSNPAF